MPIRTTFGPMDALERRGQRRSHTAAAWSLLATTTCIAALSCAADSKDGDLPAELPRDAPLEPGVPVEYTPKSDGVAQIQQRLTVVQEWDAAALLSEYPVSFQSDLGFDP